MTIVEKWKQGRTGMPFIDACMRQLNTTGFITDRGCSLLASYLTLDLKQDWRYGAHHFQEKLIDYDVHTNYVKWNALSGLYSIKDVKIFN